MSMRKKLIFSYSLLAIVLICVSTYFMYDKSYEIYIDKSTEDLIDIAYLLEETMADIAANDMERMESAINNYSEVLGMRISLISTSPENPGTVLVDSEYDPSKMENHKYREEVKEAFDRGLGASVRYSETLGIRFLYVAYYVENDFEAVLRLAVPLEDINLLSQQMLKVTSFGVALALVLVLIIYYLYVRRLTQPLDEITAGVSKVAEGNYQIKLPIYQDHQFRELAESFNVMTGKQQEYVGSLKLKNLEMQAILDSVGAGILFLDSNQEVMLHNALFLELMELSKGELRGKKIYQVIRKAEVVEMIAKAAEQNQYQTEELLFYFNQSTKIYKVTTAPVLAYDSKDYFGLLLMVEDITKLKQLENMRKDFVANVSHELKTPLTSIRGFIDTLNSGALEDPNVAKRFLGIIDLEAARLHRMIQQLLYLSQIENKRVDDHNELVDLPRLAQELKMIFEPQLREKGLELNFSVDEGATYRGNRDNLAQILVNLIDNGIKYSNEGKVTVCLRKEEGKLICQVADTGVGIPAAEQHRIFERFYRVEKSRAQKNGGTGLGLAIVKHLIEFYEGTIYVESEVNQGTTFTIALPEQDC